MEEKSIVDLIDLIEAAVSDGITVTIGPSRIEGMVVVSLSAPWLKASIGTTARSLGDAILGSIEQVMAAVRKQPCVIVPQHPHPLI